VLINTFIKKLYVLGCLKLLIFAILLIIYGFLGLAKGSRRFVGGELIIAI